GAGGRAEGWGDRDDQKANPGDREGPGFKNLEEPLAPVGPVEDITAMPEPPLLDHVRSDAERSEPPPISMIEQSRSAVWPLVAAMLLGLAIGFSGGYFAGLREKSTATATATADAGLNAAASGREATEVAV